SLFSDESESTKGVAAPDSSRDPRVAGLDSLDHLPRDWRLLDAVDLVVLPTGKAAGGGMSLVKQVTPQSDALLQHWVRGGGHLLISVGSESQTVAESSLGTWIKPITLSGQAPVRQFSSLEAFAGQNVPLTFPGTVPGARLEKLPPANTIVRQTGSSQPLVAS